MYADDLILYFTSITHVQAGLVALANSTPTTNLKVNNQKTNAIKFRNGERLRSTDRLFYDSQGLLFESRADYLGLIITQSGRNFSWHIRKRVEKAIACIYALKSLKSLSLNTAKSLFEIKIAPVATYGLSEIWEHLKTSDFILLDKVKASYLKRVVSVDFSQRTV